MDGIMLKGKGPCRLPLLTYATPGIPRMLIRPVAAKAEANIYLTFQLISLGIVMKLTYHYHFFQ